MSYQEFKTIKEFENKHPIWSGKGGALSIPKIGDTVDVGVNSIGKSVVSSYFIEHGYLGVKVIPIAPPEWYIKQNGAKAECHIFGAEIYIRS